MGQHVTVAGSHDRHIGAFADLRRVSDESKHEADLRYRLGSQRVLTLHPADASNSNQGAGSDIR